MKNLVFIILFFFVTCSREPEESISIRDYYSLSQEFSLHQFSPIRDELRVMILPDGKIVEFKFNNADNPEILWKHSQTCDTVLVREKLIRVKKVFNKLNVVAFFSDSVKTDIYLTEQFLSDSIDQTKMNLNRRSSAENVEPARFRLVILRDSRMPNRASISAEDLICMDSSWCYGWTAQFEKFDEF